MRTKKERRIARRKENLINLAKDGRVYCVHYCYFLDAQDVEVHHCYSGNHGSRYCNFVDFPEGNREGRRMMEKSDLYNEPEEK